MTQIPWAILKELGYFQFQRLLEWFLKGRVEHAFLGVKFPYVVFFFFILFSLSWSLPLTGTACSVLASTFPGLRVRPSYQIPFSFWPRTTGKAHLTLVPRTQSGPLAGARKPDPRFRLPPPDTLPHPVNPHLWPSRGHELMFLQCSPHPTY